jgi:hypothetical protein
VEAYDTIKAGAKGLKLAVTLMNKLLLSAKMGFWMGGALLLMPMALSDLCAGRVEQRKAGRRANDAGLPTSEG